MSRRLVIHRPTPQDDGQGADPTITTVLTAEQQAAVHENRRNIQTEGCRKGHNNKIQIFIKFLEEEAQNHPQFISNGSIHDVVKVVDTNGPGLDKEAFVTETSKRLGTRGYRTKTLQWNNITKEMVELYYSKPQYNCKYKKGEMQHNAQGLKIMKSYDSRRKVWDALVYGQKLDGGRFNPALSNAKEGIMKSLKVTTAEAKGQNQLDEQEADPIPLPLLRFMCKCAIVSGNAFLWVMALLQWNCMARSQNIDDMTFGMFSMGIDSIILQYNQTKTNKKGEKCSPKNCYANPFDVVICLFTALAIYFCQLNMTWTGNTEYIFINEGSGRNSASAKYCDQIKKWAIKHKDRVMEYIRPDHMNAHGIRKGSATEATSNTSETSIPSIFHRGEWSMGIVLEIYWKFAQRGDQLLGRILAGLDPDNADFDVLPPHFTVPMSNEYVQLAMKLCFGNILKAEERNNGSNSVVPALLFRCLASLVYHADAIQKIIDCVPGHSWKTSIPLFCDADLLNKLKGLVTTRPTPGCNKATGAARHTAIMKELRGVKELINDFKIAQDAMNDRHKKYLVDVKGEVKAGIEEFAIQNGHLTVENVTKLMDKKLGEYELKNQETLKTGFESMMGRMEDLVGHHSTERMQQHPDDMPTAVNADNASYQDYSIGHSKVRYFVPAGYLLPKRTNLLPAFRMWLNGDLSNASQADGMRVHQPVRPFYFWTPEHVPYNLYKAFKSGWKKALTSLMDAPGNEAVLQRILLSGGKIPESEVKAYYDRGLAYLISRYSFIEPGTKWMVTTWSRKLNYRNVEKEGNDADQSELEEPTRWNKKHERRRKITKKRNSDAITAAIDTIIPDVTIPHTFDP